MECNRDEAIKAKEIAEKKFTSKDFEGAKKFAAKSQTLYPDLEGIQQMIATFDVYISAEKSKINGEADFYAILGTKPLSDEETVRKQYRKLALMLHPDKNKSIGAEGAFKCISEAWSMLSDKAKKQAYDKKRSQNGFYNFTLASKQSTKPPKGQKSNKTKYSPPSYKPNPSTFWTVCHRCKMQYEYLRKYLNQNLLCPHCRNPFLAVETAPPNSNGSNTKSSNQPKNINFQWGPFSGNGGASSSAQAANMVYEAYGKVKRERELAEAARKKEEALKRKRSRKMSGKHGPSNSRTSWDLSHADIQIVLMKKAKIEVHKKLVSGEILKDNPMVNSDSDKIETEKVLLKPTISMDVLDSNFHDFNRDRLGTCFEANQVWAVYSYDDGMPRKYAMIHQIISLSPFKLRVCWLNSRTKNYFFESLLSVTTGEFKRGKKEDIDEINCFSHMVKWRKGDIGDVRIYPRRGDVWALYRNWSPEWNELTEYEIIHKYDIVEILEDYDKEAGVIVIPLIKVAGFKTLFHRHVDLEEAKVIPRSEIFRFSHQVPSKLLNGEKIPKALIGCRELDPAATPLEFLDVMIDVDQENILENDGNSEVENKPNLNNEENVEMDGISSKSCEEKLGNEGEYEKVEILEDSRKFEN